jgi:hypothetical protein
MGHKAALRLDAAAAMLQAPVQGAGGWGKVIQVQPGEIWHQAVLRTIKSMPLAEQDRLKGLVDWVQDYELGTMSTPVARPAPAPVPEAQIRAALLPIEDDFSSYDDAAVEMALMSVESLNSNRPRA